MPETITVKGIGHAVAKPDTVVISLSLDSCAWEYEKAMDTASDSIDNITCALMGAGFEKSAVKTTDFRVKAKYDTVKDPDGNFRQEFQGYAVSHNLKVEFDFDGKRLSQTLSALAGCPSHPRLSISFVVKDTAAVNEEMLRSATANARKKAEILCEASGAALGRLLSIDYSWNETEFCSNSRYNLSEGILAAPMIRKSIDMEPDDIRVRDTVSFVWEIHQGER